MPIDTDSSLLTAEPGLAPAHGPATARPRKKKLLVASPIFGASGQPWLWRQATGLDAFDTHLLCWERLNADVYPDSDTTVHVATGERAPYDGAGRWSYRARNIAGLNFYGAVGRDRRDLSEVLRQIRPDALLCHFGDVAMRLLPVARRHGVPVAAYLHGNCQFLCNRWYRWSLRRCLKSFAASFVANQIERRWLVDHGAPADRVHVVPCGAPTDRFRPGEESVGTAGGPVRFVLASRLVLQKGCEVSIRAFATVVRELPASELHVYGDGPDRDRLLRVVAGLGLDGHVRFHGYCDEQRFAAVLPTYDVFVQHSLEWEGFGVSIAEAAACGLPVVVTPVGGIVEQVVAGETGLLVPERDPAAMAAAMLTLARDPGLRHRMGQAGRRRAVALYDTAQLTRQIEQVMLSVVASRNG